LAPVEISSLKTFHFSTATAKLSASAVMQKDVKKTSIFVLFGDANLWREDSGESREAFACTFIVAVEAKARETFTNFVTKAKRKRSPSP
jgi:hypothetical protein